MNSIAANDACSDPGERQWYVMRDLTRHNALRPAHVMLAEMGLDYFTPMVEKIVANGRRRERRLVPFLHDLVFVNEPRAVLDPIVARTATFQYRYVRHAYCQPMTVQPQVMQRFMAAVRASQSPQYYSPGEVTAAMLNRYIRIVGGPLDGYEGYLLTTRGSRKKRLIVEIPLLLSAAVEVEPQYIQLLK